MTNTESDALHPFERRELEREMDGMLQALNVKQLRDRIAALEAENRCDACIGTGEPVSGKPCMCGGTGRMSDAARYLRERVVALEAEVERLIRTASAILREHADELAWLDAATERAQATEQALRKLRAGVSVITPEDAIALIDAALAAPQGEP